MTDAPADLSGLIAALLLVVGGFFCLVAGALYDSPCGFSADSAAKALLGLTGQFTLGGVLNRIGPFLFQNQSCVGTQFPQYLYNG